MTTENRLGMLFGSGLSNPSFGSLLGVSSQPHSAFSLARLIEQSAPATPALPYFWYYVRPRFNALLENLKITDAQAKDGETKHTGVRKALNKHYWGIESEAANSLLIGSWGKLTRVRPSRDVDVLFLLPSSVYHQYQARADKRQSALLQEVKEVLRTTYSQTATMRADGQVIVLPFNTMPVEVAVGFRCQDGTIIYCDTNNGGSYKTSTAELEAAEIQASDQRWNGNTRALARMLKQWQRHCDVPLKSFQLERLAIEFLASWQFSHHDVFYYDWMVRDFLIFLIGKANTTLYMPGTYEAVPLGDDWLPKARKAYIAAYSACENEQGNYQVLAGNDWQEIFGTVIPAML